MYAKLTLMFYENTFLEMKQAPILLAHCIINFFNN